MDGTLQPWEMLPSMHELAKDRHKSVITVQRAYEDLTRDGFIKTVSGISLSFRLVLLFPQKFPRFLKSGPFLKTGAKTGKKPVNWLSLKPLKSLDFWTFRYLSLGCITRQKDIKSLMPWRFVIAQGFLCFVIFSARSTLQLVCHSDTNWCCNRTAFSYSYSTVAGGFGV